MTVIDDINQRLDDNDQAQQDFADSLDTNLNDIVNSIDEISQQQQTDEETLGQLSFPLTQDTIDLIREQEFLDVDSVSDASVSPGGGAVEGKQLIQYNGATYYLWTFINGSWVGQKLGTTISDFVVRGYITLTSGTYTLNDSRISVTSTIVFSLTNPVIPTVTISSTPQTFTHIYHWVTKSAGQAVFHSSEATDGSTFNYLLIP